MPRAISVSMNKYPLPAPDTADVWARLAAYDGPVYIYGTGNGADKIIDELTRRGIGVAGIFASDGFVRDREFRGHHVMSYSDVRRQNERFCAVLAFGTSRPDVLANIDRIAAEHTFLCPDVPAFGDTVFDSDYYRDNYDAFSALRARLADDESRRVLSLVLEYKLTGELAPLYESGSDAPAAGIIDTSRIRTYADLGAYTGDTVRAAVETMPNLSLVYAFEPEPRAYRKLCAYAETVDTPRILTYNAAAWSKSDTLTFTAASGRGSSLSARGHAHTRTESVTALALDSVVVANNIDYIKFDVEGAEAEALLGAAETIRRCPPDLCVSVYHRTEDLLALTALVTELYPNYDLYLRREIGIPAWGINLYAKKKSL